MTTAVGTEEVSLPPAQEAGWGVKIDGEHRDGSERQGLEDANWLAKASVGRTIRKRIEPIN